jgi:hypothetical protein
MSEVSKTKTNPAERFGGPGPGRPKGLPNKTTTILKEAVLIAAENVGNDGAGKGGLVGYLQHVAATNVPAFTSLLGRVLPLQVVGDPDSPIHTEVVMRIVRPER